MTEHALCSGKSESITITNEKGVLVFPPSFLKALNSLSLFIYRLKSQLGVNQSGLGGKLSDNDKKTLLLTIKDATEWIEDNGQTASTDDLEEKLAEIQLIVSLIMSKLYAAGADGSGSPEDEDKPYYYYYGHDEL